MPILVILLLALSAIACQAAPFGLDDFTFLGAANRLPPGASGIWLMDHYVASPNPCVPNLASNVPPSVNMIHTPRRQFSNPALFSTAGTDINALGPDGLNQASRFAGTDWIGPVNTGLINLPSGSTNTLAIWAKSNTGTNQDFKMWFVTWAKSQLCTATTNWQRFSFTTNGTGACTWVMFARSPDNGTTPIDLLICDAGLFPGSADPYASTFEPLAGNLYPGGTGYDTRPVYSSGAIDFSAAGARAWIQFPTSMTLSNVTVIGTVKKVNSATAFEGIFTDDNPGGWNNFTCSLDENAIISEKFVSNFAVGNNLNLWNFYGQEFHTVGLRSSATRLDVWLNDLLIERAAVTSPSYTAAGDFGVGVINRTAYGKLAFTSVVFWPRTLTDNEMRRAYSVLANNARKSGNTITAENRFYLAEGDSITYGASGTTYPSLYGPNASPAVHGVNNAVSGSTIATAVTRAIDEDLLIPPNRAGRKFILSGLWHNGLTDTNSVPGYLSDYAAYLDARRAAGWTVVACTILPATTAGYNDARNLANTTIRTWVGVHCDALCDFAADPTMGPDAAASDTTYYVDGVHPTTLGQATLEPVMRAVINGL